MFAPQNLISDSPFSRLDVVSCRNLLIYLEPELQRKIIGLFHFALNEHGTLVLGTSETVSNQTSLFEPIAKKLRVYRRVGKSRAQPLDFPFLTPEIAEATGAKRRLAKLEPSLADLTRQALLSRYAPASVLVDRECRVLYFFGLTHDYIEQPTGEPTGNLLDMANDSLRNKLRAALHRAVTTAQPVALGGAQVLRRDKLYSVRVSVTPLSLDEKGLLLVSFEDERAAPEPVPPAAGREGEDDRSVIHQLEEELLRTKQELQGTIEELEASNEELKVSNEEAMSMNEELQSTNEELETSKEELQSLNEELSTINSQLEAKIGELEATSNDLHNLLTSTNIATIFLDKDFRIKRFTPATTRFMHLIPNDVGRSITDIASRNIDPTMLVEAASVIEDLISVQKEITTDSGEWYIRRIQPYRTHDHRIGGVVITYLDITERRRSEEDHARLAAIVESSEDAVIGRTLDGAIVSWNAGAERLFGYTAAEAIGQPIGFLVPSGEQDEMPRLIERLARGERIPAFEARRLRKDRTRVEVSVTVSAIRDSQGKTIGFSEIERDITDRRRAEEQLRRQKEQLAEADRRKDEFMAMLGHELRNPLASLRNTLTVLKGSGAAPDAERLSWGLGVIERQLGRLTHLVDDLLDLSRITHGSLALRRGPVELNAIVKEAEESARPMMELRQQTLSVRLSPEPLWLEADAHRLLQVVSNLLSNAASYTERGGRIDVTVATEDAEAVVRVRDNGAGIAPDVMPHIFEMFVHAQPFEAGSSAGLGIGLTLVQKLVELHGGRVEAVSPGPGKGSEFAVRLPLAARLAERGEPSETAPRRGEAHRVLVIEDDPDVADSFATLLQSLGQEVRTLRDGSRAAEVVRNYRPDFVFIDIGMPGIDGYEVARRLRAESPPAPAQLIALTGYGQATDVQRAHEAGFDRHFTKPVRIEDVESLLAGTPPHDPPSRSR